MHAFHVRVSISATRPSLRAAKRPRPPRRSTTVWCAITAGAAAVLDVEFDDVVVDDAVVVVVVVVVDAKSHVSVAVHLSASIRTTAAVPPTTNADCDTLLAHLNWPIDGVAGISNTCEARSTASTQLKQTWRPPRWWPLIIDSDIDQTRRSIGTNAHTGDSYARNAEYLSHVGFKYDVNRPCIEHWSHAVQILKPANSLGSGLSTCNPRIRQKQLPSRLPQTVASLLWSHCSQTIRQQPAIPATAFHRLHTDLTLHTEKHYLI
jgi:hypothetical protein